MADLNLSDYDADIYMVVLGLAVMGALAVCMPYLYSLLRRPEDEEDARPGPDAAPGQLADLTRRVKALEGEVAALKLRLPAGRGAEPAKVGGGQPTQEHPAETKKRRPTPPPPPGDDSPLSEAVETFRRLYNEGVGDLMRRQEFRDTYHPVRVGTANALARVRDPKVAPEFVTASDGDFYAVAFDELGDSTHLVVPRHDLLFQESIYGPGAMGVVFECRNYDPRARGASFKVIRPALFSPGDDRCWTLRRRGVLELAQAV